MKRIKQNGFTLMEMVVVLGIFSISAVVITEIFMTNNRTQKEIFEYQKLQSDVSYTVETIARAMRMGTIDYMNASYPNQTVSNPGDKLIIYDKDHRQTIFKKANNPGEGCVDAYSSPCIISGFDMDADGLEASEQASITPQNVKIDDLKFYILPITNPFLSKTCANGSDCPSGVCPISRFCQVPNQQPMVTIVISATQSGHGVNSANPLSVTLQTSVSSRQYYR